MRAKASISAPFFPDSLKYIVTLIKPGIILGNLIPTMAGLFLAGNGILSYTIFFLTLLGVSLIIASGCALNNVIDKDIDALMKRTQNRPLPQKHISPPFAILFGILTGISGLYILFAINFLAGVLGSIGLLVYVILYSIFLKRRSVFSIHIGSISGAIPPVIGYTAITGYIDFGAIILFLILVFWQMPHSFAISIFNSMDYSSANLPTIYNQKGIKYTRYSILFYIIAFIVTSSLLTFFSYTGSFHILLTLLLGGAWFSTAFNKVKPGQEIKWARKIFFTSILVIIFISASIAFF